MPDLRTPVFVPWLCHRGAKIKNKSPQTIVKSRKTTIFPSERIVQVHAVIRLKVHWSRTWTLSMSKSRFSRNPLNSHNANIWRRVKLKLSGLTFKRQKRRINRPNFRNSPSWMLRKMGVQSSEVELPDSSDLTHKSYVGRSFTTRLKTTWQT